MVVICIIIAAILSLSCGRAREDEQQIVLTTGYEENEIFFIGEEKCYLPELNVYVRTSQSQYENVFGQEIWDRNIGNETLEQYLKRMALYRLARIKAMKLLAAERGIELDEKEIKKCRKAADEYMGSLSDSDRQLIGADDELIFNMYSEYALADKVYSSITQDVNPEISDDEARTITVKQILIKTFFKDLSGNRTEYNDRQKQEAYARAETVLKRLRAGEDFDSLAERYNEDSQVVYSFDKDSALPEAFKNKAFEMETDEISDIVETPFGYHVIQCTNTFDRDETDENKLKILNKRKEEVFSKVYDSFVQSQYSGINEEFYNSISYDRSVLDSGGSFFDVYNRIFAQELGEG